MLGGVVPGRLTCQDDQVGVAKCIAPVLPQLHIALAAQQAARHAAQEGGDAQALRGAERPLNTPTRTASASFCTGTGGRVACEPTSSTGRSAAATKLTISATCEAVGVGTCTGSGVMSRSFQAPPNWRDT